MSEASRAERTLALAFTLAGLGWLGACFYHAGLWWGACGVAGVVCLSISGHIYGKIRNREIAAALDKVVAASRAVTTTTTWPRSVN